MAVSAKQASVEIQMVPAPTSTSRCDIKACREKHDTEKQQDRGYYGMTPPSPFMSMHVILTERYGHAV